MTSIAWSIVRKFGGSTSLISARKRTASSAYGRSTTSLMMSPRRALICAMRSADSRKAANCSSVATGTAYPSEENNDNGEEGGDGDKAKHRTQLHKHVAVHDEPVRDVKERCGDKCEIDFESHVITTPLCFPRARTSLSPMHRGGFQLGCGRGLRKATTPTHQNLCARYTPRTSVARLA